MESDPVQISALLYLLSAMSAMAFVISPSLWLWSHIRNPGTKTETFSHVLWAGQTKAFIFTVIVSIFISVWDFIFGGHDINIIGEMLILGIASYAYFQQNQSDQGCTARYFLCIRDIIVFGFVCVLVWGITIAIGFLMYSSLNLVFLMNSNDVQIVAIMIPGLLWNAPIVVMHMYIVRDPVLQPALKGKSLHRYMWPVLIAYLVLLLPFIITEISQIDVDPRPMGKAIIKPI